MVSLGIAILGALKLILESVFKVDLISDEQINAIANGAAAIITIVGVAMSHRKKGGDAVDTTIQSAIQRTE